jgi:hypothetical protein
MILTSEPSFAASARTTEPLNAENSTSLTHKRSRGAVSGAEAADGGQDGRRDKIHRFGSKEQGTAQAVEFRPALHAGGDVHVSAKQEKNTKQKSTHARCTKQSPADSGCKRLLRRTGHGWREDKSGGERKKGRSRKRTWTNMKIPRGWSMCNRTGTPIEAAPARIFSFKVLYAFKVYSSGFRVSRYGFRRWVWLIGCSVTAASFKACDGDARALCSLL